jgi:glycosyltransferase involved in cell wall biosynthesis
MPSTVLFTCSDANSLRNFRGRLIESLRSAGHELIAVAPSFPPAIENWCSDLGVKMEPTILDNQSLNPFRDLRAIGQLYRIMKKHRPDVVMGYTHKPALYSAFAGKMARVPRVAAMVTGMGFGFEPGGGLLGKVLPLVTRLLFRFGCAASDVVIFHNKDNRDFFLSEKVLKKADKAVVVGGSGVDLSYFSPQPLEPAAPGELTFLLIGRIVRYKGILEYARAADRLRGLYPKARFLLAGYHDSNPLAYSEEEWRFIRDQLEYLGSSEDVRPLYRQAHVYVLPSYGEGMPRTVLEAMATGRAIVTTDTYGCRDTVEEGVNGNLVPIRNYEGLAEVMERFLSGASDFADMGKASLERVRRLFDVELVNRDMVRALGLDRSSAAARDRIPAVAAPSAE